MRVSANGLGMGAIIAGAFMLGHDGSVFGGVVLLVGFGLAAWSFWSAENEASR